MKQNNMNCVEEILNRRSIRKFKNEAVTEKIINTILEAGRLAPTATNQQPWYFVVAKNQEDKEAFIFKAFNRFVTDADFIVLGLYKKSEIIIEKFSLIDVTIALQNMVITATVQGIGSCWMGAFDEKKLRDILNLPDDCITVGAIAFGIPDEQPKQPPKKKIDDIVHFNKW